MERLTRDAVDTSSLEEQDLVVRLDRALSKTVLQKVSLCMVGDLEPDVFYVHSNPHNLVNLQVMETP